VYHGYSFFLAEKCNQVPGVTWLI